MIHGEIKMLAANSSNVKYRPAPLPNPQDIKQMDFSNEQLQGFIKHPERFPLHVKRLNFWEKSRLDMSNPSNIGLTYSCDQPQKLGSILEITVPTRKETHAFKGKVVAIREKDSGYDIGVWLINAEDAPKLRIIEQICHIELYLNDKKYREGPFVSPEKITQEWIGKYASHFPVN